MDLKGVRESGLDLHDNGEKLKANAKLKLLGFGQDPQPRGEYQTGIIQTRVAPRIRALNLRASTRWDCDASTLLSLYRAYARPVLECARQILLTINNSIKDKMEVYPNSFLRLVSGESAFTKIGNPRSTSNFPSVMDR